MRRNDFKIWLADKLKKKSSYDCISRCGRVERLLCVDLDKEFIRDNGVEVKRKLGYSIADERANKPAPDGFSFNSSTIIRYSMTDYRSAVKHYFLFCVDNQPKD